MRAARTAGLERRLLALQALIVTGAAIVFAVLPPAEGPVLAVSLRGHSAQRLIGAQTRLLGEGRWPGSFVITGSRPSFWTALVQDEVLILPALPALCGSALTVES